MTAHLRRVLLAGLTLAPAGLAAAWKWWTRGCPRDILGAATWTPAHDGPLDPTGLFSEGYADEVEASLWRLRNSPSGRFTEAKRRGDVMKGARREN